MSGLSWRRLGRRRRRRRKKSSKLKRAIVWGIRIAVLTVVLDIFYLTMIWPTWPDYESGDLKSTAFIDHYQAKRKKNKSLPKLKWQQVEWLDIPRQMKQALIVAEDGRFYEHKGFDMEAFKEAMTYNLETLDFKYGASTISQQTVKNLFLSSSRNPLRKINELVLTLAMEEELPKLRILEIYMNVAEFGQGVYGVAAAAQHYYGVNISRINRRQAAELAATLPSPRKHNPSTRSKRFLRRAKKIYKYMSWVTNT